jgi:hypothetical protein
VPPRVSVADVAKHLNVSERHIYKMLREGTCDRSRARQLVIYFGGVEADYLRDMQPRGRPRKVERYTFRQFVAEEGGREEDTDDVAYFIRRIYNLKDRDCTDSSTLASFLAHVRNSRHYCDEEAVLALDVWRKFRIWQIERECADRVFDIEMGGEVV